MTDTKITALDADEHVGISKRHPERKNLARAKANARTVQPNFNLSETKIDLVGTCTKAFSLVSCAKQHVKSGRTVEAHRNITCAASLLEHIRSLLERRILEDAMPAIPPRLRELSSWEKDQSHD